MNAWQDTADLARWDQTLAAWRGWTARLPQWEPSRELRAVWDRVEPRLNELGKTLDRVLVVGILGGTGTGKSTLINALVGERVCPAGDVQRPTTRQPLVLHHPNVSPRFLPLTEWSAAPLARDLPLLEHLLLIDCPDPDTQGGGSGEIQEARDERREARENAERGLRSADSGVTKVESRETFSPSPQRPTPNPQPPNTNLTRLRAILPHCDVLLCLGTAQKYKTAAVLAELRAVAPGRAVIFIQTHADYDPDIRSDWKQVLEQAGFADPQIVRLDSERALQAVEDRLPPPPEYRELRELLERELNARGRARIRRANALDLVQWYAAQADTVFARAWPAVESLDRALDDEANRLLAVAQTRLGERLQDERGAWRTRLLGDLAAHWGGGPFGVFLRVTGSAWNWLRWAPLFRARGLTSLVLTGGVTAGQALAAAARRPDLALNALAADDLGWSSGELAETLAVVNGKAEVAGFDLRPATDAPADRVAARQERLESMLAQTQTELQAAFDRRIATRVAAASGPLTQFTFELLFTALPAALLGRLGYNFFYRHLWLGEAPTGLEVLIQGLLWVLLWGWLLRYLLSARLLAGWQRDARECLSALQPSRVTQPLFDELGREIKTCVRARRELQQIQEQLTNWRAETQANAGPSQLSRLQT